MTTAKELAVLLNGREYGEEMSTIEERRAKTAGLVVVFGASDDLMEFRGSIHDECYPGDKPELIDRNGPIPPFEQVEHDEKEAENWVNRKALAVAKGATIQALWCKEDGYSWTFKTSIPHETFEIVEGEDKYCRGIVFKVSDI